MPKKQPNKSPRAKFLEAWRDHGFKGSDIATEYAFDEERKWKFDIAFPSLKVAVEIDGFGYGHQSIVGRSQDNIKQNAAIEQGWVVLRYTTAEFSSVKVVDMMDQVKAVLEARYLTNKGLGRH